MFIGPSLLHLLPFTLFWGMRFDKNSISVEVSHLIRVFIHLLVK